jgi:hypothetical protein
MIKVITARYLGNYQVALVFSDNKEGIFDGTSLLQRHGTLIEALRDENFFKLLFVDMGALCWPNGLELSPARLYRPEISRHCCRQRHPAQLPDPSRWPRRADSDLRQCGSPGDIRSRNPGLAGCRLGVPTRQQGADHAGQSAVLEVPAGVTVVAARDWLLDETSARAA